MPEGFRERGLRYGLSFCLIFKSGACLDKKFELNAVFIFDMGFGLEHQFFEFLTVLDAETGFETWRIRIRDPF